MTTKKAISTIPNQTELQRICGIIPEKKDEYYTIYVDSIDVFFQGRTLNKVVAEAVAYLKKPEVVYDLKLQAATSGDNTMENLLGRRFFGIFPKVREDNYQVYVSTIDITFYGRTLDIAVSKAVAGLKSK